MRIGRRGEIQAAPAIRGTQPYGAARGTSITSERFPSAFLQVVGTIHQPMASLATRKARVPPGGSSRRVESVVRTRGLSAVQSGGRLVLPTSPVLVAGAAHSSCGPAAIAPGANPRSSADQLPGLGVPGALGPVPEHPQKRTRPCGHTVAVGRVGRTSPAVHADLETPLVGGQEWRSRALLVERRGDAAPGRRGPGRGSRITPL